MSLRCFPLPARTYLPRPCSCTHRVGTWFPTRSSLPSARRPKRRCVCCSSGSGDPENVDIDQLARQLSSAARSRRSLYQSPFAEREEDFDVDDFEVVQALGYLSVKVTKPPVLRDGAAPDGPANNAAVLAFVARYFTGKPYQYPVLTLLKEYLPAAKSIAENEFRALSHLSVIPEDKWEAASSPQRTDVPVVQLLGVFRGSPRNEDENTSERQRSLWFVFKWEKLKPLSAYYTAEQSHPGVIWPWGKSKKNELNARRKMIRGVMNAVRYCHSKGVVHGSLGSGSVLLSTFDDYSADSLLVKLDNFGFASHIPSKQGYPYSTSIASRQLLPKGGRSISSSSWTESSTAVAHELRSVGLLFLETVILSLTESKDPSMSIYIERLAMEIFLDDFAGLKSDIPPHPLSFSPPLLRAYCMNEPNWSQPVLFLNEREGAGWKLLNELLKGNHSPSLEHRFLD